MPEIFGCTCITRILPIADAVASVNRSLTRSLEEFRGFAKRCLESEESLRAYYKDVETHRDEALNQLLRRRAIDRVSSINLNSSDEALWIQVRSMVVRKKTSVKLSYAVERHPSAGSNRIAKRIMVNMMRNAKIKFPKRFINRPICKPGRTHVLVLRIDALEKSKSRFVGNVFFVSVPMELTLMKCPRGEELSSLALPEALTREETSFGYERSEELLWKNLTDGERADALARLVAEFLDENLGL